MTIEEIRKVECLKKRLSKICIQQGIDGINGFTVFTNGTCSEGYNIVYRRNLKIEEIKNYSYCSLSFKDFNQDIESIKYPYTGFLTGNILGWTPLSASGIVELLHKYDYSVGKFLKSFKRK